MKLERSALRLESSAPDAVSEETFGRGLVPRTEGLIVPIFVFRILLHAAGTATTIWFLMRSGGKQPDIDA